MTKRSILLGIALCLFSGSILAQLSAYDVGLRKISTKGWAKSGESLEISGEITNLGTQVLESVKINWAVGNQNPNVFEFDGLNLSKSHSETFIHDELLLVTGAEDIILKVWVSDPNGEQDEKSRNDTLYKTIQVINGFPKRMILLEEFTGTWCGWCPRGPITYRDIIKPNYPNVILAALHNGDDMVTSDGNTIVSTFASAFPTGMIDRKPINSRPISLSTEEWVPSLNDMDMEFTPAEINVYNYYWPDTYEWKIEVVVDFIMDYSGDLRLNCIILEDSVTGTGSGYNQVNYYNTRTDYPELQGIGSPIVGYPHNHVVREMISGPWGQSGIIPKNVKRGERYILSKIIKPKVGWDMRQIRLVGILQAYSSSTAARPILNATETELHMATGYSLYDLKTKVKIFPNPVNNIAVIDFGTIPEEKTMVEVINISGQSVYNKVLPPMTSGKEINIDMADWNSGIYFVRIVSKDKTETIKVIKE